jgi:hypothetical protein
MSAVVGRPHHRHGDGADADQNEAVSIVLDEATVAALAELDAAEDSSRPVQTCIGILKSESHIHLGLKLVRP